MNRIMISAVVLGSVAILAALAYLVWRSQLNTIVSNAKAAATADIITGATQAAAAADEALATARDPDAAENALASGNF